MLNPEQLKIEAEKKRDENKNFYASLKKQDDRKLDKVFHELHYEIFADFDCLSCANCCKTTSPLFQERDIERLSKHLKIKPMEFTEKYLRKDEDNDWVLKSSPCPFLDNENYCLVYEARPSACREYPHTNRKRIKQIQKIHFENTFICPAVFEITEKAKIELKKG